MYLLARGMVEFTRKNMGLSSRSISTRIVVLSRKTFYGLK